MATPLEGTESAQNAIARVTYTHDAMIDLMLANPMLSQGEIARHFGYTQAWVSRVRNSDAFLARLAERKTELVDPGIAATIDEKLRAVADKSLEVVLEKLSLPVSAVSGDFALKALECTSKALGYGAREKNLNVQQNFVVALPGKAESEQAWMSAHGRVIEQSVAGA
jgi:hypothetical protein